MTVNHTLLGVMRDKGWFQSKGTYTLFDGQYGSTGKGLLASVLMESSPRIPDVVTTNAGPNSGHTAFITDTTGLVHKVITRQLPVSSVHLAMNGTRHVCYLNAGAVLDLDVLGAEIFKYAHFYKSCGAKIVIHPHAAVIHKKHMGDGEGKAAHVASTGKGVGPAMADKLVREVSAVFKDAIPWLLTGNAVCSAEVAPDQLGVCMVEVAQGWSLGLNSGFYPYVTSRECGVSQALSDLAVAPSIHRKSIVSLRTYPIRVGNTDKGTSGPCFPDQKEISFESIGVPVETTTVTGRPRRLFTWSDLQFEHMLRANAPDALFINFCNYMPPEYGREFVDEKIALYKRVLDRSPDFVLLGFGPHNNDVRLHRD